LTILRILQEPDPRLRVVSEAVTCFDDDLAQLVQDMIETMRSAQGIGLAAPQVNIHKRLVIIETTPGDPFEMINPVILEKSPETNVYQEGCLSVQGAQASVTRPASIQVEFQDRKGIRHQKSYTGIEATCIQHELDHLDGILFIDHLSPLRKRMLANKKRRFAYSDQP
jgi:peptide deformylase